MRTTGALISVDREWRRGNMKNILVTLLNRLAMSACASGQAPTAAVELKHFPLDSLEGVRATTGASFDPKISQRMEKVLCESTPRSR